MTTAEPHSSQRMLVEAALAGDDGSVAAALAEQPDLASQSVACALVLADAAGIASLTSATVNNALSPHDWPPLLYVCNSRYRTKDSTINEARVALAEALLELGADPNAGSREAETIRGYRTALGAAIGRARSAELARVLLAAGADVADGPTLYEGCAMWEAVRHDERECLRLLLAAKPPQWHVCHALPHALRYNDPSLVNLLLEHGGNANWTMGIWGFKGNCLHEAVLLNNDTAIVRALLEHGAQVSFQDRDGRTPLAVATCLNRTALAAELRGHGANDEEIRPVDRWVSACFAGNPARARQLANVYSGLPDAVDTLHDQASSPAQRQQARQRLASCFKPADHLWVCRAIGRVKRDPPAALGIANNAALRSLLAGGLDPNAMDDDGEYALHLAAAGNASAIDVLLDQGADVGVTNFRGQTPLDVAVTNGQKEQARALSRAGGESADSANQGAAEVFEQAADAVVDGDIDTLQALLRAHPTLAFARSSRPHHCTLLNYLGANGFEGWRQRTPANAVAIIDLLIEAGADANAVCYTYRGGPDETTLGLLATSNHPKDAGLTLAMLSALARGGAQLDDVYRLLVELYDANRQDRLADAVRALDNTAQRTGHALVESAMLGETAILFALADAGVDINARRTDGTTALHQAAIEGNAALAEALLERGADLSLRDPVFDGTPVGWAQAGGHDELGKTLAARMKDER